MMDDATEGKESHRRQDTNQRELINYSRAELVVVDIDEEATFRGRGVLMDT